MNNKTFYPFYQARIERMIQILKKECAIQEVIADGAWMQIASGLYQIFHRAAVRTLIVEMHKCLREGRIKRSTPKNEYNLYLELLKNPDYREEISEHYPGLETYLDVLEDNQYDFWMEFFERLNIVAQLSRQKSKIFIMN